MSTLNRRELLKAAVPTSLVVGLTGTALADQKVQTSQLGPHTVIPPISLNNLGLFRHTRHERYCMNRDRMSDPSYLRKVSDLASQILPVTSSFGLLVLNHRHVMELMVDGDLFIWLNNYKRPDPFPKQLDLPSNIGGFNYNHSIINPERIYKITTTKARLLEYQLGEYPDFSFRGDNVVRIEPERMIHVHVPSRIKERYPYGMSFDDIVNNGGNNTTIIEAFRFAIHRAYEEVSRIRTGQERPFTAEPISDRTNVTLSPHLMNPERF